MWFAKANAVITRARPLFLCTAKNLSSRSFPTLAALKRSRLLLRTIPKEPDRQSFLDSMMAIGGSLGASVKHPRWTSYGALEVDVFTASVPDFQVFLAAIEPLSKAEVTKN